LNELELEEREERDLEGVSACRCCFYALYLRIQVLQGLVSEISLVINFYLLVSLNVIIILLVRDFFEYFIPGSSRGRVSIVV
jgi:hypothetical protein